MPNPFLPDDEDYPGGPFPVVAPPVAPGAAPVVGDFAGGAGGFPAIGGGGGGGLGAGAGSPAGPRPTFNFEDVPGFTPPTFQQPTLEQAMREPGYQFRLNAGSDALERSAAARGVLRTGGTLKDITEYGQNFGAQEYGNVFNRALSAYDREYRGAYDAYAPQLAEWQFLSQAEQAAGMAQFANQHSGGGGGGGGYPMPLPPGGTPEDQPGGQIPWQAGLPGFDPYAWRKPGYGGGNYGMPPDWQFPNPGGG